MKFILFRSGNTIPIDEGKVEDVISSLESSRVVSIKGQYVLTSEIVGVVDEWFLDDTIKSKRGMWRCEYGYWHRRFDDCQCEVYPNLNGGGQDVRSLNGEKEMDRPDEIKKLEEPS